MAMLLFYIMYIFLIVRRAVPSILLFKSCMFLLLYGNPGILKYVINICALKV